MAWHMVDTCVAADQLSGRGWQVRGSPVAAAAARADGGSTLGPHVRRFTNNGDALMVATIYERFFNLVTPTPSA